MERPSINNLIICPRLNNPFVSSGKIALDLAKGGIIRFGWSLIRVDRSQSKSASDLLT